MEEQRSDRQQRELEYHRHHAQEHASLLNKPFSWDVLDRPSSRWWNAYWQMYAYLVNVDVRGKTVLVVGCGFGDDALRVAKLGAKVYAFDLSPESLTIAKSLAEREGLTIHFEEMPAETLRYESDFFDYVLARDILHHVDIPRAISEIRRVSKQGAVLLINEVYSHSLTDHIRHSRIVENWLYPAMQRFLYDSQKPYITQDERKLTERDLAEILRLVPSIDLEKHFNFLVNRIVPERVEILSKLDRLLLICARPFGRFLAGRLLLAGRIVKEHAAGQP
jgi:ubiquinone/menaquinone biosynthesis C-methylase UbiE